MGASAKKKQGFHINDGSMVAAANIIGCLQICFQVEEIDIQTLCFCLFDLELWFLGGLWVFFFVIPGASAKKK